MPLPPLYGHESARERLTHAIAAGRLPQAILLAGPRGVGKQRLALWIAQTLLCEGEQRRGEPCESCRACKLVRTLSHPDLHWFVPVETAKKGGDADKQVELVEEALAEELANRRGHPLYGAPSGLANHGIASVRLLLRRLALTPVMGGMKVFVIGDADRLVPQIGADQAANALLKSLEEPPYNTQFVLTTADADALLPTILSRVVRVNLRRLPDSVVTQLAQHELGWAQQDAVQRDRIKAADGSPGRLIASQRTTRGSTPEGTEALLRSLSGTPPARYAFVLKQKPFEARGAFTEMLDGLLERLRREARAGGDTAKLVEAIAHVMDAREMAQGNVNPQLVAATLADDLADGR